MPRKGKVTEERSKDDTFSDEVKSLVTYCKEVNEELEDNNIPLNFEDEIEAKVIRAFLPILNKESSKEEKDQVEGLIELYEDLIMKYYKVKESQKKQQPLFNKSKSKQVAIEDSCLLAQRVLRRLLQETSGEQYNRELKTSLKRKIKDIFELIDPASLELKALLKYTTRLQEIHASQVDRSPATDYRLRQCFDRFYPVGESKSIMQALYLIDRHDRLRSIETDPIIQLEYLHHIASLLEEVISEVSKEDKDAFNSVLKDLEHSDYEAAEAVMNSLAEGLGLSDISIDTVLDGLRKKNIVQFNTLLREQCEGIQHTVSELKEGEKVSLEYKDTVLNPRLNALRLRELRETIHCTSLDYSPLDSISGLDASLQVALVDIDETHADLLRDLHSIETRCSNLPDRPLPGLNLAKQLADLDQDVRKLARDILSYCPHNPSMSFPLIRQMEGVYKSYFSALNGIPKDEVNKLDKETRGRMEAFVEAHTLGLTSQLLAKITAPEKTQEPDQPTGPGPSQESGPDVKSEQLQMSLRLLGGFKQKKEKSLIERFPKEKPKKDQGLISLLSSRDRSLMASALFHADEQSLLVKQLMEPQAPSMSIGEQLCRARFLLFTSLQDGDPEQSLDHLTTFAQLYGSVDQPENLGFLLRDSQSAFGLLWDLSSGTELEELPKKIQESIRTDLQTALSKITTQVESEKSPQSEALLRKLIAAYEAPAILNALGFSKEVASKEAATLALEKERHKQRCAKLKDKLEQRRAKQQKELEKLMAATKQPTANPSKTKPKDESKGKKGLEPGLKEREAAEKKDKIRDHELALTEISDKLMQLKTEVDSFKKQLKQELKQEPKQDQYDKLNKRFSALEQQYRTQIAQITEGFEPANLGRVKGQFNSLKSQLEAVLRSIESVVPKKERAKSRAAAAVASSVQTPVPPTPAPPAPPAPAAVVPLAPLAPVPTVPLAPIALVAQFDAPVPITPDLVSTTQETYGVSYDTTYHDLEWDYLESRNSSISRHSLNPAASSGSDSQGNLVRLYTEVLGDVIHSAYWDTEKYNCVETYVYPPVQAQGASSSDAPCAPQRTSQSPQGGRGGRR